MSDPFRSQSFPRGALVAAALLIGSTMLLTGAARLGLLPESEPRTAPLISKTELRFGDLPDGGVGIATTAAGNWDQTIRSGEDGFVRSVMRGFARERRMYGVGEKPPFMLSLWADGRLTLADPQTGREIVLNAFGEAQIEAFARFLPAEVSSRLNVGSTAQR